MPKANLSLKGAYLLNIVLGRFKLDHYFSAVFVKNIYQRKTSGLHLHGGIMFGVIILNDTLDV